MVEINAEHTIQTEQFVAERVEELRLKEGWSYADLSQRMAAVGCAIERSSLQKIERGTPRRKITVNELVAFAAVFGIDVTDLLVSPQYRSEILFWTDMQDGPGKMRTLTMAESAYDLLAERITDACLDPQEGLARIRGVAKRLQALKSAESHDSSDTYLKAFLTDIRARVGERLGAEGKLEWLREISDGEGN
ncbi:hypothetical protein AHiyo8_48450 [Arthrobacter sp. Hiyo8]|uniref:helix-turn-helix domain-containing protein n=1 Tax=Arthrobacter sp. Hiyo1 TaxID=1588020 RepID=UPI000683971A|nr:helix-turn-helix transcriptional regulator [Arthrobacter sp. Hiyo1]BAS16542.1 hypothetical protein AHiyo8_48450 [Arthrobacter sp. Hiyo8]GAP57294.1 hypothetical protein AHiyo1_01180 [Arthrobacter sp. Hiyo1]